MKEVWLGGGKAEISLLPTKGVWLGGKGVVPPPLKEVWLGGGKVGVWLLPPTKEFWLGGCKAGAGVRGEGVTGSDCEAAAGLPSVAAGFAANCWRKAIIWPIVWGLRFAKLSSGFDILTYFRLAHHPNHVIRTHIQM
jgi:hypothetical protein